MGRIKSNILKTWKRAAVLVFCALVLASATFGIATRVFAAAPVIWTGAVSTDWFDPANWQDGAVPGIDDEVVIDGGTNQPLLDLVDGSLEIKALTVGGTNVSTLTVAHGAPETNVLHISGDLTIANQGIITHAANGSTQEHRLAMLVDGNALVAEGGKIDASGKGYSDGAGPGNTGDSTGPAHGGDANGGSAYGDISTPSDLGSGGRGGAGGAGTAAKKASGDYTGTLSPGSPGLTSTTAMGGNGGDGGGVNIRWNAGAVDNYPSRPGGAAEANGTAGTGRVTTSTGAGGGGGGNGGSGGGSVWLSVGSELTIRGAVVASGVSGTKGGNGGAAGPGVSNATVDGWGGTGGNGGSGGAGGSIFLSATTIDATGSIAADGGSGGLGGAGGPQSAGRGVVGQPGVMGTGGSGGRVSLRSNSTPKTTTVSAKAGAGTNSGGAGTVLYSSTDTSASRLVLNNEGTATNYSTGIGCAGTLNLTSALITLGAKLTVTAGCSLTLDQGLESMSPAPTTRGNLEVANGGVLSLPSTSTLSSLVFTKNTGGVLLGADTSLNFVGSTVKWFGSDIHESTRLTLDSSTLSLGNDIDDTVSMGVESVTLENSSTLTGVAGVNGYTPLVIEASGPINIDASSKIDVSSMGLAAESGEGSGARATVASSGGGGAGYGGVGGNGSGGALGGGAYGSALKPVDLGSGGGGGTSGTGAARGGGALQLISSEAILLEGSLLANGEDATTTGSTARGGGGSGGSIYLEAPAVSGAGTVSANGGKGVATFGGGGGGGRVSIERTNPVAVITEVSPARAGIVGGETATITGSGFTPDSKAVVRVTDVNDRTVSVPVETTYVDATTLEFIVPEVEFSGTTELTVTTESLGGISVAGGGGFQAGQAGTINPSTPVASKLVTTTAFQYYAQPVIYSVLPSSGFIAGGDSVTISGQNFREGATVMIGDVVVSDTTVVNDSTIVITIPVATAAGHQNITVINDDNQKDTLARGYAYKENAPTAISINPTSGPALGGQAVSINGTNFVDDKVVSVVSSDSVFALMSSGKAYGWGVNNYGQLGNGLLAASTPTPTAVDMTGALNGKKIEKIVTSTATSYAVTTDGKAYSWGRNNYGQLGNGTTNDSPVPVAVNTDGVLAGKDIVDIVSTSTSASASALVLTADGRLYSWGRNNYGQLGNGTTNDSPVPVAVNTDGILAGKAIKAITSGSNSYYVLTSDGAVYSWGYNDNGELGDGSTTQRNVPVAVVATGVLSGKTVTTIAAGNNHLLALTSDGKVYSWGYNYYGQLGNNGTANSSAPVTIPATNSLASRTVTAIAVGPYHSLALTSDARVYGWGQNISGQLGDGSVTQRNAPVAVIAAGALSGKTVTAITTNQYHSLALSSDGRVYGWGRNNSGQLGDNSTTQRNAPAAVSETGALAGKTIAAIAVGPNHSLALSSDGRVYSWGQNNNGQLGNTTTTNATTPGLAALSFEPNVDFGGDRGVEGRVDSLFSITTTTPAHTAGLVDVTVTNYDGQSAVLEDAYEFIAPPTLTSVTPSTAYVTGGDTIVLNGSNFREGSIVTIGGVEVDISNLTPTAVSVTIPAQNAGVYDVSITDDLGQKATLEKAFTYVELPPAVTGVTPSRGPASGGQEVTVSGDGFTFAGVRQVVRGTSHTLALTADGKVYSWGYNAYGGLGNNSTANSPVPVAVTGALAGKTVTAIAAGSYHSLALTSDGTVYSWGQNTYGQLGNNSTTQSNVPVAVTSTGALAGKTVTAIAAGYSHSLALTLDGEVYGWGNNANGQLGNGGTAQSNVPVAVTSTGALAGKTVTAIVAGYSHSLALTSDGTVYSWGQNTYGQLGNNSTTQSNVPVTATGALAGRMVTAIAAGQYHSLARTSDGKVYGWGYNYFGQLGNNSTANSSVPVTIPATSPLASKTVTQIAAGSNHSLALTSEGAVYSWGYNTYGQLGDNTTNDSLVPIAVTATSALAGKTVVTIAAGGHTSSVLASDGKVYSWGLNSSGQFGNNTTTNSSVPVAAILTILNTAPPSVAFGATNALDVHFGADTSTVIATTPAHDPGLVGVTATNYDGQSSTITNAYEFVAPPTLNNIAPSTGYVTGGDTVTLSGSNFSEGSTVTVGGVEAVITNLTPNAVTITTPTQYSGTYDVVITDSFGQASSLEKAFTYQDAPPLLTDIAPNRGPANGGQEVTINGQSFATTSSLSSVSLSSTFGCGIAQGRAYCWGANSLGQLGDGTTTNRSTAVPVVTDGVLAGKTIVAIGTGGGHTVALDSNGNAYAWGNNALGQLGNNTFTQSNVPVAVSVDGALAGKKITAIATGDNHSLALSDTGEVYGWGLNTSGQLGNGLQVNSPVPVGAAGILAGKTIKKIAAGGGQSLALDSTGAVYRWGPLIVSQTTSTSQGNNTVNPVLVALSGKTAVDIAAGALHALVLTSDNMIYGWGGNIYGTLGNNTTVTPSNGAPVVVTSTGVLSGKTIKSVAAGYQHSMAISTDGLVYAWGRNTNGQLGDHTVTQRNVPVAVLTTGVLANKVVDHLAQSSGSNAVWAFDGEGSIYGWGYQPEIGSTGNQTDPISLSAWVSVAPRVTIGGVVTSAKIIDSTSLSFITPPHAQGHVDVTVTIPDGQSSTLENAYEFVAPPTLDSLAPSTGYVTGGDTVTLSGSNFSEGSTVTVGGVEATITNITPNAVTITTPAQTAGVYDVVITDEFGQKSTLEKVFTYVELPPVVTSATPNRGPASGGQEVTVSGEAFITGEGGVQGVGAGGYHSLALALDGKVYNWGRGGNGQLGNNTTSDSLIPVAVTTTGALAGKTVTAIAAGGTHSLALTSDGKVYSWGLNGNGQLGNNSTAQSNVPVAVTATGTLAGKTVIAIAAGNNHSLALTSDGAVYSWGLNTSGQLGNNSTTQNTNPVYVTTNGALAGKAVTAIAAGGTHSLALTSEGKVYSWGQNTYSQLGNNSTTQSNVPVAVIATGVLDGKVVTAITAGYQHSLALTSEGKVYSWGYNNQGQLGDNTTTRSSVPVAVTATGVLDGKVVTAITAGYQHSLALTSDGKVYSWGYNNQGQLGNDTTINEPAPVEALLRAAPPTVTFDTINALNTHFGPDTSTIIATTPPHDPGFVDVTVTNPDGQLSTLENGYEYVAPPTITGVAPATGSIAGGETAYVSGTNFTENTKVKIGLADAEVVYVNATTLLVTVPASATPGEVDVVVSDEFNQSATAAGAYTYTLPAPTIASVTPAYVKMIGGAASTITGSGFVAKAGGGSWYDITVDGEAAANVQYVNATTLRFDAPAHAPGKVSVTLGGQYSEEVTLGDAFEYLPVAYSFTNEARSVMANEPAELTVEMRDENGDPVTSTQDITLSLTTSSATGFFARALTGENAGWDYDTVVVPAGQSSATFYYRDAISGTPTVTIADALTTQASQQVTIGSPYKILVTGVSNPTQMGTPSSITVQAVDYMGVPQADYRGTVHFTSTDGAATLPGDYTFTAADRGRKTFINGVTMGTIGTWDITATDTADGTVVGTQEDIIVGAPASGTISSLHFITPAQSFPLDQTSGVITVQTQDANGVPIPVESDTTVYARTTSSTGQFSIDGGANWLDAPAEITITAGSSYKNILYRDATAGSYELKVSQQAVTDFGWGVAEQSVTVGVGAPAKLGLRHVSGAAIGQWLPVDVTLTDSANNIVTTQNDVAVELTISAGGTMSASADGANPVTQLTVVIATGQQYATVWVQSISEPSVTLHATDARPVASEDAYEEAVDTLEFGDATPTAVTFNMPPSQAVVKAATPLQVSLKDEFGNIVMAPEDTAVTVDSTSQDASFAMAANGVWQGQQTVNVVEGTTTAAVYFKHETVKEAVAIAAHSDGLQTAEASLDVIAGQYAGKVRFAPSNAQQATAGESTDITVELLDAYGNPTIAGETVSIGFGSHHDTQSTWNGDEAVNAAAPSAGYTVVIPAGEGTAQATYRDTLSGLATLQAYDQARWSRSCIEYAYENGPCSQYSAWSNSSMALWQLDVAADKPVAYAFTSEPQVITKNTASAPMTVELHDQFGNATSFDEPTTVNLTTASETGGFDQLETGDFTTTSVSVVAGQSTFTVYYKDSELSPQTGDELTITGNGLEAGQQNIRVIEGFAAQAVLDTAGHSTAVAGDIVPVTLRAQTNDAVEVVVLNDTTFTLAADDGEFSLTETPFVPISTITLSAETSQRPLFYRSTVAGLSELEARSSKLDAVPTELAIVSSAFYKLGYTSLPTDGLIEVTKPSSAMVATAYDEYGNVATPSVDQSTNVTLTSSRLSGDFALTLGEWNAHATEITAGATTTRPFYYRIGTLNTETGALNDATVLGLQTITAASTGVLPATTEVRIVGALATRVVFTSGEQNLRAGQVSAPVTIQLQNTDGTPAVASAAQTVSLSSLNLNNSDDFQAIHGTDIFSLTPGGDPITSVTIPAGSSVAEFYVMPQSAEVHRIRASAAIVNHDGGYLRTVSSTQRLGVTAGDAASLSFTTTEQTIHPDEVSAAIRFTVTDAYGNRASNTQQRTIALSSSCATGEFLTSPTGSPVTEVTMNSGENEITMYYKAAEASAAPCDMMLETSGLEDAMQPIVVREPVYALAITSAPQTVEAGQTSAPMTVETRDRFGNTVTVEAPLTLTFEAEGGNSTFTPTSRTIARGGSSTQFTYRYDGSTATSLTIRVSAVDGTGGVIASEQAVTVLPGEVTAAAFNMPTFTTGVGDYQPLTLQVLNAYGKRTVTTSELSFALSTSAGSGAFYQKVGSAYEPITTVTLGNGATQSPVFYYRQTTATQPTPLSTNTRATLTAQRSGLTAATSRATIKAKQLGFSTGNFSAQVNAMTPMRVTLSSPLPSNVTVTLSTTDAAGKFYATESTSEPITTVTILAGRTQSDEVYYLQDTATTSGYPERLTATATDSTMTVWGGTVRASFYVNQFSSLVFVAPQASLQQGEQASYSVEARDDLGNVVPFTNSISGYCIYIGSTSGTATIGGSANNARGCVDTAGKKAVYVSRYQTRATFTYKDSTVGEATVTAANSTGTGGVRASTTVAVTPGITTKLAFARTTYGLVRGDEVAVKLQLTNDFGFVVNSNGDTLVTLTSDSATGVFYDAATDQWKSSIAITVPAGQATVEGIRYSDTTEAASTNIHATADGLASAQAKVNLGVGVVSGLRFTDAPATLERGQTGDFAVEFVDDFNNETPALTDFCLYVDAQGLNGIVTPGATDESCADRTLPGGGTAVAVFIQAGETGATFTYRATESGTTTLRAATVPGGGGVADSHSLTIEDGELARVGIEPVDSELERGGVLAGRAVLYNAYDAEVTTDHDVTIHLTGDFIDGTFALAGDGPWTQSLDVTVPAGSHEASFLYQADEEYLGEIELQAVAPDEQSVEGSSANVTVVMGEVAQLVFATPERTTTATHPSETMVIEARNRYGVETVTDHALTIYLRSSSSTGAFALSTVGPWGISTATLGVGQSQVTAYYRDEAVGSHTIIARDKLSPQEGEAFLMASQQHHIVAQVFDHFVVTNISSPTKAGIASSVVVFAVDSEDYVVADYAGTVSFSSDDPSAILPKQYTFVPETDKGIHTFNNGVAFRVPGVKSVTAIDKDNKQGTQFDIIVEVGNTAPVREVAFADASISIDKSSASHSLLLTLHDVAGALTNAPAGGMPIRVTSDSSTGLFSLDGESWSSAVTLTVESGLSFSTTPLYYKDSTGGSVTLTARDWIAGVDSTQIINGELPVTINDLDVAVEQHIYSTDTSGAPIENPYLFSYNDRGDIRGYTTLDATAHDSTTGDSAVSDWRIDVAGKTEERQGTAQLSYKSDILLPAVGAEDYDVTVHATKGSLGAGWQGSVPVSPWKAALNEAVIDDTILNGRLTITRSGQPADSSQVVIKVVGGVNHVIRTWHLNDLLASGLAQRLNPGVVTFRVPLSLFAGGDYTVTAQLSDGVGITAEDATQFTVAVEAPSSPTVPGSPVAPGGPVAPGAQKPGGDTGTISPESPGDNSSRPEPVQPTPPRDGAYEQHEAGLLTRILRSPETPVRVAQSLLGLLIIVAGVLLYQMYREWRHARFLLAIIRRDNETIAHKDNFLQLAAHHLRTPLTLLTSGGDMMKRTVAAAIGRDVEQMTSAVAALHEKAEAILTQTGTSNEVALIAATPTEKVARRTIYRSPIVWVPLALSVVLTIIANMLVQVYGEQTLSAGTIAQQIILLLIGGVLLYTAARMAMQRRERRKVLEQSQAKVRALNTAKITFARKVSRELTDDILHLNGYIQQVQTGADPSVASILTEGLERLERLVARFTVLNSVYDSKPQQTVINVARVVDEALQTARQQNPAVSVAINEEVETLTASRSGWFVTRLFQDIFASMAPLVGGGVIKVETHRSKDTTEVVITGPAQHDAPAEDLFSVYSRSDQETAGTFSTDDQDSRMHRLDLYLDQMIADELQATLSADRVRGRARVTIALPNAG